MSTSMANGGTIATMGFLDRIRSMSSHETWATLDSAAQERYYDGLTLATSEPDRGLAALYLWSYVPELLVKVAWYRTMGVAPSDDVRPEFNALKSAASLHSSTHPGNPQPRLDPPALHDPVALLGALISERSNGVHPNPMDPGVAGAASLHAARIRSHASVHLRYESALPTSREIEETLESVDWFLSNAAQL